MFLGIMIGLSGAALLDQVVFGGAGGKIICTKTAAAATIMLQSFEPDTSAIENQIWFRQSTFNVIVECTGVDLIALFIAAVAAFPTGWRHKLAGILLIVPLLTLVNLARIILLVLIGTWWPETLEYAHLFVAPFVILTITLGLWSVWADRAASVGLQ